MQHEQRDNHDHLILLKDEILGRLSELPPEHQASLGLVVVQRIAEGDWGMWFTDALTRLSALPEAFPNVERTDLQSANFAENEIEQLSDADLATITHQMREHYVNDLFADELRFHTEELLTGKGTQS